MHIDKPKTKRVRIAIAIDRAGDWQAFGGSSCKTDRDIKEGVFVDALLDGEQFRFIEAEIPLVDEPTINGEAA